MSDTMPPAARMRDAGQQAPPRLGLRDVRDLQFLLLFGAACAGVGVLVLLTAGSWWAAVLWIVATGSALGAFRLAPVPAAAPAYHDIPGDAAPYRSRAVVAAVAALGLAVWASVLLYQDPVVSWSLVLYPLALGLCWCGEGWLRGQTIAARLQVGVAAIVARGGELALVAALLAGAALLRVWMIGHYPFTHGSISDEPLVGGLAYGLAHGTQPWPLYQTMGGAVSLFQPIAAAFVLFGSSMVTFRGPLVVTSVLLIPAFYVCARQFVTVPAAACGTALLGLAYWPAMLGLLAFGWLYGPTFQLISAALLVYGARRGSATAYAASGTVLALCLYSYIGHRTLVLPVLLVAVVSLVRGTGPFRRRASLLLVFLFGFVAAALPWVGAVSRDHDLLYGDSLDLTRQFHQELTRNVLTALSGAAQEAGQLISTVFAYPRADDFVSIGLPDQGLLDTVTAVLVLLGVGYGLVRCLRAQHLFVLSTLAVSLAAGSIAQPYFVNTYRLNSGVAALFLAATLFLDRCLVLAGGWRHGARWAAAVLVVIAGDVGVGTVRTVASHLADCQAMTGISGFLSSDGAENILVANQVNALGPRQAAFIVSHNLQIWIWNWLYRRPMPVEYSPVPGEADPARWPVLNGSPPAIGPQEARFWPPRLASGQTGITYLLIDTDAAAFLPTVQHRYPGGREQSIQTAQCPTFTVTSYSLTRAQLSADGAGSAASVQ